jgi:hypothetical protein
VAPTAHPVDVTAAHPSTVTDHTGLSTSSSGLSSGLTHDAGAALPTHSTVDSHSTATTTDLHH